MKRLFSKLKTFFDAYKMYVFFMAILFGTNGAQFYASHEPEPVIVEPVAVENVIVEPVKTIIIHKVDNKFCIDLLNEHKTGAQH